MSGAGGAERAGAGAADAPTPPGDFSGGVRSYSGALALGCDEGARVEIRKETQWRVVELGLALTFEPIPDTLKILQDGRGYLARYLVHDEDALSPVELGDDSPEAFLVHYHRQFWVERADLIQEQDLAAHYNGAEIAQAADYRIFTVSAYIHGGVSLALGPVTFPFDAQGWDTSRVGAILIDKAAYPKRKDALERAESLLAVWNQYLSGDCYTAVVERFGPDKAPLDLDTVGAIYGHEHALEYLAEMVEEGGNE